MGVKGGEGEEQVGGKREGLNLWGPLELVFLSEREGGGMRGVAVKCIDITKNSDCEGSVPALN